MIGHIGKLNYYNDHIQLWTVQRGDITNYQVEVGLAPEGAYAPEGDNPTKT